MISKNTSYFLRSILYFYQNYSKLIVYTLNWYGFVEVPSPGSIARSESR